MTNTPEETALDRAWDQLADETNRTAGGNEIRYINRHQLAEFMTDAALQAIDDVEGKDTAARGLGPLVQSLKAMGEAAKTDHTGWSIIARRARQCVNRLTKDVTRFLTYPGSRVAHATVEADLQVTAVRFHEDGRAFCTVVPLEEGAAQQLVFPLHELVWAGPVNDSTRELVRGMIKAVSDDMVAQLVERGVLQRMPSLTGPEVAALGQEVVRQSGGTVHHLQTHPEYVMEPGSKHAEPCSDAAPWQDHDGSSVIPCDSMELVDVTGTDEHVTLGWHAHNVLWRNVAKWRPAWTGEHSDTCTHAP